MDKYRLGLNPRKETVRTRFECSAGKVEVGRIVGDCGVHRSSYADGSRRRGIRCEICHYDDHLTPTKTTGSDHPGVATYSSYPSCLVAHPPPSPLRCVVLPNPSCAVACRPLPHNPSSTHVPGTGSQSRVQHHCPPRHALRCTVDG